jgi:hypothetical protein
MHRKNNVTFNLTSTKSLHVRDVKYGNGSVVESGCQFAPTCWVEGYTVRLRISLESTDRDVA